jgi:hypothetical protein
MRRQGQRPGKLRVLSKNPSFTGCVTTLRALFPDARFVCCFRDPSEAIPSQLSSLRPGADAMGWDPGDRVVRDRFVDMYQDFARRSAELAEDDDTRVRCLSLEDLSNDVSGSVTGIYRDFGWHPEDEFGRSLAARAQRSRTYRSRHRYDVDQFGLIESDLNDRFGDLMKRLQALATRTGSTPAARVEATP